MPHEGEALGIDIAARNKDIDHAAACGSDFEHPVSNFSAVLKNNGGAFAVCTARLTDYAIDSRVGRIGEAAAMYDHSRARFDQLRL